jgi:hypothetical protein
MVDAIISAIEFIRPSAEDAQKTLEGLASGTGRSAAAARQRLKDLKEGAREAEDGVIASVRSTLTALDEFSGQTASVIELAMKDTHNALMAPLPSAAFEKFVADAEKSFSYVAKKASEVSSALGGNGTDEEKAQDNAGVDAENEAEKRLSALRDSFKSEIELLNEQNVERLNLISDFETQKWILEDEAAKMREQQAQQHAEAIARIHEAQNANTVTSTADMWGQLESLSNSRSRKLFEIGKAAALANALIKAPESIINSYAHGTRLGGPPVGAAFAAVAAATTANMIGNIRSQSFGSSGAGATTAAGGAGGGQAMAASASQEQRQAPLEVRMSGLDAGSMFSGQMISTMFDRLRDEAGDRGVRFIA